MYKTFTILFIALFVIESACHGFNKEWPSCLYFLFCALLTFAITYFRLNN